MPAVPATGTFNDVQRREDADSGVLIELNKGHSFEKQRRTDDLVLLYAFEEGLRGRSTLRYACNVCSFGPFRVSDAG